MSKPQSPDRFNLSAAEELIVLSNPNSVFPYDLFVKHALNWKPQKVYLQNSGIYNYFLYELSVDVPVNMLPQSDNIGLSRMKFFKKMIGNLNILPIGYMPEFVNTTMGRYSDIGAFRFKVQQNNKKKTYKFPFGSFIRFFFVSPNKADLLKFKKKLNKLKSKITKLDKKNKSVYSFDRRGGKKYFRSLFLDYKKKHPRLKEKKMPRKKSTKKSASGKGKTVKFRINQTSRLHKYFQEGNSYFKRIGKGRKTKITKAQFIKAIDQYLLHGGISPLYGKLPSSNDLFNEAVSNYSKDRRFKGRKAWTDLVKEYGMKEAQRIKKEADKLDVSTSSSSSKWFQSLPKENKVAVASSDNKFKFKIGKRKVPEKMKETPRSKATKLYIFPSRKSYPIGDLYHARAAVLRVMWPSNKKNRGKVLRGVIAAYPSYNWKDYWEKERKEAKNSKTIKSFSQTIKMK